MLRLAEKLRDEAAFLARTFRLSSGLEQGDLSTVDAEAPARRAQGVSQPLYRWRGLCPKTMRRILAGHCSQAESLAEEALHVRRLRGEMGTGT